MINIPLTSTFKNTGFKQAETSTQKLTRSLKGLALTLGTALSARKIAQFGKASVLAASNLEEAVSKATVVFGRGSAQIEEFGRTSATSLGISSAAAIEAAGTYGNLLQAFGIGQAQAQGMSLSLVQLAADMASFNNTPIDQAITALRSGLSGETEPLKRYGVALQDVRLKTEALRMGLISSTTEALTPATKAQAAYELILKDTVLAQGDFERTSGGVANSLKILSASATNAQTIIGTKLIQSMDLLVDRQNGVQALADSFEDMAISTGNISLGLADVIKDLKTLGGLLPGEGFKLRNLTAARIPLNYLEQRGQKLAAKEEAKAEMISRANAKEQGILASRNFSIQKKTTAELTKQNKLKKDTNKLDKASSMLDLEKIQIEAALQGELTDNERLRLQLMKALVNENADRAEYLAKELEKSQNSIAKLKNSLTEFKPSSPFQEWIDAIERIRNMLAGIGVGGIGMPGSPVNPSTGSSTLGGGLAGDPRALTKVEEQLYGVSNTYNINVEGSVVTQQELEKVIVDTVVGASANGYTTGWFRTTGAVATL